MALGVLIQLVDGLLGTFEVVDGTTGASERRHSVRALLGGWALVAPAGWALWHWYAPVRAALGAAIVPLVLLWVAAAAYLLLATLGALAPGAARTPRHRPPSRRAR